MKATILRPAIPITDRAFQYTPSHETDLGKKFRKLMRAQQQAQPQQQPQGVAREKETTT